MNSHSSNREIITKLMFRLLPSQITLAAVPAVNGIVSGFFATNYVGVDAMTAVGLYTPVGLFVSSVSVMLAGGSSIMCGKYLGKSQQDKLQNIFSINLLISTIIAAVLILLYVVMGVFDLTEFFTDEANVRPLFNTYLLGQAIGILPLVLGTQLPAFLSIENKGKRTMHASLVYIAVNLIMNLLFIKVLHMETFGLALAPSIGMWVFFLLEAQLFVSGKTLLRIRFENLQWGESIAVVKTGFPGAATNLYQTARGLIVNKLIEIFVGGVGISAFATANNLLAIFWAVPAGMLAVSRLLISVSVGEEDRQTLTDIMRVMFLRFVPLMCGISGLIIICAVPLTRIFYHDPSAPVYAMTVAGFSVLPLCMPLAVVCMHFTCYAQVSGKQILVHAMSLLDGVINVTVFTALLIRYLGINSVYTSNIINGLLVMLVPVIYAAMNLKRLPRNMSELMSVPADFGVPEENRMDMTIRSIEEVVSISVQVQEFCASHGIDPKRSMLAALALEEMAGNIVDHGFTKDNKEHSIDVRVSLKDDDVILRTKDNCVPFDPAQRLKMASDKDDPARNFGIKMVFKISKDVQYRNILGLNVLTIRI